MNTTGPPNPTRPNSFIEDGTYLIVNASPERRNHVILADDGSLAAGSKSQDGEPTLNLLWDVKRLENERYTIRSSLRHEYAAEPRKDGGAIVMQANENDWIITETRYKGQFVVGHIRKQVFWGLADDDIGTPVTLRDKAATRGNSWVFKKYEGALPNQSSSTTDPLLRHLDEMLKKLPNPPAALSTHLRDLAVHNATYDYRSRSEGCLEGTRKEVIEDIMKWTEGRRVCHDRLGHTYLEDFERTLPICWLSGSAGAGKSAIAQEVATRLNDEKRLLASFFFRRGEGDRSSSTRFIFTLAYQLSRSIPVTAQLFQQILHDNPALERQLLRVQFDKLLINLLCPKEPIAQAEPTAQPLRVVVIDALDECDDKSAIREFIQTLVDVIPRRRIPFLFFITSRVEVHIREEFEPIRSATHRLSLDDFDARIDIHEFLRSRFKAIYEKKSEIMAYVPQPWPSNEDINTLVEKASGLFIFASTLVRFVETASMPHDELQKLLDVNNGIDPLYSQVFSCASRGGHFDRVISTVILLHESLPVPQISRLLRLRAVDVLVELLPVQSVLKIPGDDEQPVQVMHTSLRDFLTTKERSTTFFIDPPTHHAGITVDCLTVILDHQEQDPFLDGDVEMYASQNWYQHCLESFTEGNKLSSHHGKLFISLLNKFQSMQVFDSWVNTLLLRRKSTVKEAQSILDRIIQGFTQLWNRLNQRNLLKSIQDIQRRLRADVKDFEFFDRNYDYYQYRRDQYYRRQYRRERDQYYRNQNYDDRDDNFDNNQNFDQFRRYYQFRNRDREDAEYQQALRKIILDWRAFQ